VLPVFYCKIYRNIFYSVGYSLWFISVKFSNALILYQFVSFLILDWFKMGCLDNLCLDKWLWILHCACTAPVLLDLWEEELAWFFFNKQEWILSVSFVQFPSDFCKHVTNGSIKIFHRHHPLTWPLIFFSLICISSDMFWRRRHVLGK